jgi:cysteine-rich repeat protein
MLIGSNSACIEKCGDGENYGLHACDDGNTDNGDGCSSTCTQETDFYCRGGFMGNKDSCYYVMTELKKATVDENNNILLEFTRAISFNSSESTGLEIYI